MHTAIAAVIFAATLVAIVTRPWRIAEPWSAAIGAALMILTQSVGPASALSAVTSEWNLFLFFFGLMVTAAVADMAGFFDWAASLAVVAARGSGRLLLLNVLIVGTLITTFLSNDATAVILTPVVYTIVTRLRLRVMPYLLAVSFIANSASMTLPISNPINLLTGEQLRAPLGTYEAHLLVASLAAVAITGAVFITIFWRTTAARFAIGANGALVPATTRGWFFRTVLVALAALAAAYVVGSALLWPLGVVAATGGAVLALIALGFGRFSSSHIRAHVSPLLFVYIAGLFVLVRAVEQVGITSALVGGLVAQVAGAPSAVASGVLGTAVSSNLVNNLPAQLIFLSGAHSAVASGLRAPFLFGALAGSDLGPNLTPVGALSTMLWLVIVRRRGVEVSAWDFLRIGAIVAPLTVIAAGVLIALSFR